MMNHSTKDSIFLLELQVCSEGEGEIMWNPNTGRYCSFDEDDFYSDH